MSTSRRSLALTVVAASLAIGGVISWVAWTADAEGDDDPTIERRGDAAGVRAESGRAGLEPLADGGRRSDGGENASNDASDRSGPDVPPSIRSLIASAPNLDELTSEFDHANLLREIGPSFETETGVEGGPVYRWAGALDASGRKTGRWLRWEGATMNAVKHFDGGRVVAPYLTFHANGSIRSYTPRLGPTGFREGERYLWRPDGTLEAVIVYAKNAETGTEVKLDGLGAITSWTIGGE